MLISLHQVGHEYTTPLFRDLSETLSSGDVFAIYGPSWVGKTTLLCILGRLFSPKHGNITFHSSLTDRQKDFWYAFVGGPFFEDMTAKENILFLDSLSHISPSQDTYHSLLQYFEMEAFEHIPVRSLSVWQRERVNIIRAFVHNPQIIILDEPGSNLDERLFQKLFTFLEEKKHAWKHLIIMATHNQEYKHLANKILTLKPLQDV